jgi:hypothetical protein
MARRDGMASQVDTSYRKGESVKGQGEYGGSLPQAGEKGSRGTAHANKMMQYMSTQGGQEHGGYHPPSGSAGSSAHGEYSTKHNPLKVPVKGSSIPMGYGNADTHKACHNKDMQLRKEMLRGQAS